MQERLKQFWPSVFLGFLAGCQMWAQAPVGPMPSGATGLAPTRATPLIPAAVSAPAQTGPERRPDYVLGPEDQILIRAFQAEEISEKPIQISGDGYFSAPMIGRVHAAGLTVVQLEAELVQKLSTYIEHPQVTVLVSDYRSQPVSVVGEVTTPGIVQLRGPKNLVQVISLAGGLRADAGNVVTVSRERGEGKRPLPNSSPDPTGQYSVAQINLRDVLDAKTPQNNVLIETGDTISVSKAQMVYVIGEVERPGGYVLSDHDSLSLLQALSLAGGLKPTASPKKAKVLREQEGQTARAEVPSDVKKILAGNAPDMSLHADDILFIPNNVPKQAGLRALESAVNIGTGLAIWRF